MSKGIKMGETAVNSEIPEIPFSEEEIERDVLLTIENLISEVQSDQPDAEFDERLICEDLLGQVLDTVESQLLGQEVENEPEEVEMAPLQSEPSEVKIETVEPSSTEQEESSKKNVKCHRCKASSSWIWRKSSTGGGFVCTNCDSRDSRFDEEQPPTKRTHRDSLVLNDGDSLDLDLKSTDLIKIEADADGDFTTTPLPTRKSSRSTRSTLSNSNPYAYPRPVVSKPKEKKSVIRNAPNYASPSPVLKLATQVRYRGTSIRIGDIVSVRGHDGAIYYAQIRGLLEDQYCDKSAALTWLLPTKNSPPPERGFDPDTYILGMEEDVPRSLESMEFVMHAPSDYFKLQLPYGFEETYSLNGSSTLLI
ncbi:GATA zinc finger domain-containing protein 1-like [Cloeon dipterum]|uniref:GATA zinc finger domain-containing protein 1-like n=1 Tax=Cloeon dipterum TaxID=197152 RepID=UPI003220585B